MADPRESPAMQQYLRFKKRHPDCILLFRIGDFYELFDDDAVTVSKALGLTLTQRSAGIPMAGMPYHQLDTYLRRLIAQGFRVAVCEQLMEASQVKSGVVPRAVTRVITPGTLVDETLLEGESAPTLGAVCFTGMGEESPAVIAVVEVSTGAFTLCASESANLVDELMRRGVRELLYADTSEGKAAPRVKRLLDALGLSGSPRPGWHFRMDEAREALLAHFKVATVAGFGLQDDEPALAPAGALVRYLQETQTLADEDAKAAGHLLQRPTLAHLRPPRMESSESLCVIDAVSLRSLEVERPLRAPAGSNGAVAALEGSLLGIFFAGRSCCRTPMGKRLLRDWLCRPLRVRVAIMARQSAVAALVSDRTLADQLCEALDRVQDVSRIGGRISLGRATPRDLVALARSIAAAPRIAELTDATPAFTAIRARLQAAAAGCSAAADRILAWCVEEPPPHMREGGLIREGVDAGLDEARLLQRDAGTWLSAYQTKLAEEHNLPGLKVGYNRVFGYYIELPAAQARTAPPALERKQTLRNAERFTTPELRTFESKVTTAEGRALEREREMFAALCQAAAGVLSHILEFGDAVAQLDALLGLGDKAFRRGWARPEIVDEPVLQIHGGRHPVLDEKLAGSFVPNDTELGAATMSGTPSDGASLALITGPNMAGKSTYIRQTALIALLAHTGSFVPADRATIGIIDRIFTRIGADDALHAGQSTFMVEMIETANILNHATPQSLVVLDEVGRGTSTLDGLSLAWAIAEHLAGDAERAGDAHRAGPRALFATHYHELTDLEERLPGRVKNLHVAVREWPQGDDHAQIVFLHRILHGRTDQSYGLHVARLAGIPACVVARGREVMASLTVQHSGAGSAAPGIKPETRKVRRRDEAEGQLALFREYVPHPAVSALREVKLEGLTPLQAFDALRKLTDLVRGEEG